jgi:hypothetical protein
LHDHPDSPAKCDGIGDQQPSTSTVNLEIQFMSGRYVGFSIAFGSNKIAADLLPMTFIQRVVQGSAADKIR